MENNKKEELEEWLNKRPKWLVIREMEMHPNYVGVRKMGTLIPELEYRETDVMIDCYFIDQKFPGNIVKQSYLNE